MRYTTVIDISEYPAIYRSTSARMIYLHLALKSGYHDNDRDLIDISIRRLAYDVGLTVGATRHALELLQREKIIMREDNRWRILKWTVIAPPTPRTKAAARSQGPDNSPSPSDNSLIDRFDKEVEEYRQRVYKAVRQCSKEQLHEWLKELEEGRRKTHYGASINPNQENIEWLKRVIERL